VPADCDCTDLDGFMLNVERLMASELVALSSHEVVAAALFLWCRAWKQKPAASLPDDERVLAAFSRLPLPRFRKLRDEALRGFVKCSDGRFYHPVLAEEARKAFERKTAFRKKRETDAERLRKWRETQRETGGETSDETRFVAEGQGQGQGQVVKKEREEKTAGQAGGAEYAFFGRVIRLRQNDLERWVEAYHGIPDLFAALRKLDDYYAETLSEKDRHNWFIRTSAALDKQHQEATRKEALAAKPRGITPLGVGG